MRRLLLVEDEGDILTAWQTALVHDGYAVYTASGTTEALELLAQQDIDLLITDLVMPGRSGMELTAIVKDQYPDTLILAVTGGGKLGSPEELLQQAVKLGADNIIRKPICLSELRAVVQRTLLAKPEAIADENEGSSPHVPS